MKRIAFDPTAAMAAFDVTKPDTWPVVLKAEEVAAIFRCSPFHLRRKARVGQFIPAPFQVPTAKGNPYLWKRSDVARHVGEAVTAKRQEQPCIHISTSQRRSPLGRGPGIANTR